MFSVGQEDADSRLDMLVLKYFPGDPPARSQVKTWIKDGLILVDGIPCFKPSQRLFPDRKVLVRAGPASTGPLPLKGRLEEFYKDDHILVLNKQAGISVHPAQSLNEPTLVNHLLERYSCVADKFSGDRPGIVHRLDKNTSGLMVVALDPQSASRLAKSFHDREVGKKYLAIVAGCPDKDHGQISSSLGRDPKTRVKMTVVSEGRPAMTEYQVLYCGMEKKWSLVRVEILTGRTHQIRAHMSKLGHPVLGDSLYGGSITSSWGFKQKLLSKLVRRQLLHSARLEFIHPETENKMCFTKPPPKDFLRPLLYMERRPQRVVITGAVGSGKSAVMSFLAEMGHPVFVADKCVAELYEPGNDGWRIIKNRFGSRFIDGEGQPVNKTRLARAAFGDKHILTELGHLIHPLVRHRLDVFWKKHRDKRMAFAEIPLIFEAGMEHDCDFIAGVFCPDELRYSRLSKNRDISSKQLDLIDKSQQSQASRISRCAMALDNSARLEDLRHKVHALTRVLRCLRIRKTEKKFLFFRKLLETC